VEHRAAYNIRVNNLSVAAGVYESYTTDPLTVAAARAVEAGIVVVTAAGNLGRTADGKIQYGGITAPGNAPWVLTVGAASHNGTVARDDDVVAPFSSLGPTSIDLVSKPDLVAPGVGIESLADVGGTLFATRPEARLWGTVATPVEPYLSLSGTSMAAPVVAGTVALMLEANPALQPETIKTILQVSADRSHAYSRLAQGAGFLDARAAVELALKFVKTPPTREQLSALSALYPTADAIGAVPCDTDAPGCRVVSGSVRACSVTPGCFEQLAGGIAGMSAPRRETVLWGPAPQRRLRRRRASIPGRDARRNSGVRA